MPGADDLCCIALRLVSFGFSRKLLRAFFSRFSHSLSLFNDCVLQCCKTPHM